VAPPAERLLKYLETMNYSEITSTHIGAAGGSPDAEPHRHGLCDLTRQAGGTVPIRDNERRMRADDSEDSPSATGRSLVPVNAGANASGADARRDAYRWRPSAVFLAQLVAAAQGVPQTRARRRAAADHAAAHYAAATRIAQPSAIKKSM
jgi:hypothetical protein